MRALVAFIAVVVGGCSHSDSKPAASKSTGPMWTPVMFNTLHALTPNCEERGNVWNCTGDSATSTVTLDDTRHLVSLEVTDLTRMSDEPPRRFRIALEGIVPHAAIEAIVKHLATAWPTETEKVAGVEIIVTRTQKQPNTPVLHDVTIRF